MPDYQFPQSFLTVPPRSGRTVSTKSAPGQGAKLTPEEQAYTDYSLRETAAGKEPMPPEQWWQQNNLQSSQLAIPRKLSLPNVEQDALQKLNEGIEGAQNYVRHNDILAPYPPGTTIEQAMADVRENTGVDLPKLMADYDTAANRPGLSEQILQKASDAPLGRAAEREVCRVGYIVLGGTYRNHNRDRPAHCRRNRLSEVLPSLPP